MLRAVYCLLGPKILVTPLVCGENYCNDLRITGPLVAAVLCVPSSSSARANGVNFNYVIIMVSNPKCMFPWTITNMNGLAVKS